ncbi:MAG TPA: glycosyltransferase family 2 protein [Candidatus Aquilonibacter sp.]|nr:glycosyltransferase family 2 protein [Candidatus Aquilonibacter sp.]
MLTVFCFCLALIVYVYAGYPLLLRMGLFGSRREWKRSAGDFPSVTVIVPAHNEEASIGAKIENLLASGYPREQLDILIGSDGSSDRTEEIVRRYCGECVGLVSFPQQHGKSAIQNGLVALASGEMLVFTDADCLFKPGTLTTLIERFADCEIGLVTARPQFCNSSETSVTHNEGIYLRYETWLREEESTRGLLTMASGSLFAMRKELWRPIERVLGDDFALPLRVARAGFRSVLEPRAVAFTRLTQNEAASMFRMKVRIIAKDFRALLRNREVLNPFRYGGISCALWSHKLLRWLVPYFLLTMFAANLFLVRAGIFSGLFALQIVFYALACLGLVLRPLGRKSVLSVPASFCLVNAASLVGTLSCAFGRSFSQWKPVRASQARMQSRGART